MREFATRLSKHFSNGLRPTNRMGLNQDYLNECKNTKVAEDGLVPYEAVTVPFSDSELSLNGITISFPFPQLFKGKGVTLLVTQDEVFTVDESDWTLTAVTISGTVSGSGIWQFIDMYDYWILFNGTTTIYKTNIEALTGDDLVVYAVTTPSVNTGTYHKGRGLIGGFGSDFWTDDWLHILDEWKSNLPPGFIIDPLMEQNYVMWSTIGGGDLLWFFNAEYAVSGTMLDEERTVKQPKFFEYLKRNEMGFMPMPWQGEVHAIHPLGDSVIVYGDDGISALVQVTDPAPTYSLHHLLDVGIMSRGAIGVSDNRHIFIDNAGFLWQLTLKLELTRLNYQENFTGYTGDVLISYDSEDNEFHICSSTSNKVLSVGLGDGSQAVSSIINVGGSLLGIAADLSRDDNGQMLLVTEPFDLDIRGIKSISFVDLDIDTTDIITVAIDYRYNKASSFQRSTFKPLNNEGWSYQNVSGVEFRLVIKGLNYTLSKMSRADVRYKLEDKRGIRGINVSETSSR